MRLLALQDRTQENNQVGNPDDRQPQVDVPLRFGVLLALAIAHYIAERGHHNEELVAPEHEVRQRLAAEQACPAGALHDPERGSDQRCTTEGEDSGRGAHRTEAAEIDEGQAKIEGRPSQFGTDMYSG